jgi:ATP-binding cassette subfamily B protein
MNKPSSKMPKLDFKTFKRLLSYIFIPYKVRFLVVMICILISSFASVAGSLFLRILIDSYIVPLSQNPSAQGFSLLLRALLVMLCMYALGVVATYVFNRLMITIAQGTLKSIRDEMFIHMQKLPIKFFDTHAHGDLMSLYTNDADTLRQMVTQSIPNFASSIVTVLAIFFAMLVTSWQLTILVLVSLFLMLSLSSNIARKSGSYFIEQQKAIGKTNGYIEEMINAQKVIKVFTHEEAAKADFDKLNEELNTHSFNAHRFANILMPIMGNISYIQYVLVAIVGGLLAIRGVGALSLGAIASFLQLSRTINMPINQMANQLNSVAMALAGTKRIFALLDEPIETDDGYIKLVQQTADPKKSWAWLDERTNTLTKLRAEVCLQDVEFGYNEETLVLKGITIHAQPGQKIALVGATGAGKTTITNLINRFYDLADGKIRYDGININKIQKQELRRSLTTVLQEVHLFSGTVMENIRYGRLDAKDEEVIEAAKLANADSFISHLPQGYQTQLSGDGSSLSQGQRQLICIARSIVADPPVLILDEATSSIDTYTEQVVQKGMDALMEGRTVFVIAHRLSTIHNADQIIVLQDGRIIEQGNHQQLMELEQQYYRLYTGAFELE